MALIHSLYIRSDGRVSFNKFILKQQYEKVKGLGDRLELMRQQINWKPFIPLVKGVFHDDKEIGGRPHTDELVVVRSMLLQAWYNLSDPELEFQCHDRLSFRNFLGFPEQIPDFTTIWKIRDRLEETGVDKQIWDELQHQLDVKGFEIKKGTFRMPVLSRQILGRNDTARRKKPGKKVKLPNIQRNNCNIWIRMDHFL